MISLVIQVVIWIPEGVGIITIVFTKLGAVSECLIESIEIELI